MATPTGARHRDLEQRLRDIEAALRSLTGAALKRRQLSVTSGDFVVSGGGSVVVEDAGGVQVRYASGRIAAELGSIFADLSPDAMGVVVRSDDATDPYYLLAVYDDPVLGQQVLISPDGLVALHSTSTASMAAGAKGAANDAAVTCDTNGSVEVTGTLVYASPPTTGAAANVNYNATNGNIRVVTSSRRYKQDIADAPDRADELLAVKGRTWRDKAQVSEDPGTETRHVGYIAEELDRAGLTEYVDYDDHGRPDAIQYDRLTVPLLQLAQRQQQQLDTQAQQIAALSARLDAVEHPKPYA